MKKIMTLAMVAAGEIAGTTLGDVFTQTIGASIIGDTSASAKVAMSTSASPVLTALSGLGVAC